MNATATVVQCKANYNVRDVKSQSARSSASEAAAIFKLVLELLTISCSHNYFMVIS